MIRNIMQLFEILSLLHGLASVYGEKIKYNVYDALIILMEMVLFLAINEKSIPDYFVILAYLSAGIYCIFRYNSSVKKAMVNMVIVVAVISVVQIICYIFVSYIFKLTSEIELFNETISSIVCFLIFLFIIPKLKLKQVSHFLLKQNKLLGMCGVFVIILLGNEIWKIKQNGMIYARDYILIISFVILLFFLIMEWKEARAETEKNRMQLEMNTLYYDAYEGLIQSIREKQHDFKNHMNAISGILYMEEDCEDIVTKQKAYFKEILGDMEESSLLTMIENPLLSGFLIRKIQEAEEKGIVIDHQCVFEKQILKVPEYKLVEMMGILLDNAIEATREAIIDKRVWIRLWKENGLFCFSVVNFYVGKRLDESVFEMGKSSKGTGRGLGLNKLRRLCEECDGNICMEHGIGKNYKSVNFEIHIPI